MHVQGGHWTTRSTLTENDSAGLVTFNIKVTIRGSRSGRKLPHVNWENAIYRSNKMFDRWDLVGKKYGAAVQTGDVRTLTLYDDKMGTPFVLLNALPPYSATPHSLDERRRIAQWRDRGGIKHEAGDDAVQAYHAFVRSLAATTRWAADAYVTGQTRSTSGTSAPPPAIARKDELLALAPRTGAVDLFGKRS